MNRPLMSRLVRGIRKPGIWLLVFVFLLITLFQYAESLEKLSFMAHLTTNLGLTRFTLERILYLLPIIWAGVLFGLKGGVITSSIAVAIMLPRAILISPNRLDAILETIAVFIVGNLVAFSLQALRQEQEVSEQLRASEHRYRGLFESAHDAIWVHDMNGNIIAANKACVGLTGYDLEELQGIKVSELISGYNYETIVGMEQAVLGGKTLGYLGELKMIKKDGTEALIQLASSMVGDNGLPTTFQCIARDVTVAKRMEENLHYFLQQITRAQEEERRRIAHELHDDTIQALAAHSLQIDELASNIKRVRKQAIPQHLEELHDQVNNITQGLRRLSQDLRPAALDRLGLLPALEWLASNMEEYSGIEPTVKVLGTVRRLSDEVELVLFRIVQEALRNVWKHARATRVEITVEFEDARIRITVEDNGSGFSLMHSVTDLPRSGKLGLAGMRERSELLRGTITIESEPEKGTAIIAEVPV
ncbi:PAS domain-containing sensor histidine kinase [Chloroflexota bacterium]